MADNTQDDQGAVPSPEDRQHFAEPLNALSTSDWENLVEFLSRFKGIPWNPPRWLLESCPQLAKNLSMVEGIQRQRELDAFTTQVELENERRQRRPKREDYGMSEDGR